MKRPNAAIAMLVGLVGAGALLGGCANKGARSQEFYTPADGVSGQAGDIAIRNIIAVQDEDGMSLLATFIARGDADELAGVTIDGQEATITPSRVELPTGTAVTVGTGEVSAEVGGLEEMPGGITDITFTFRDTEGTSVQALVLPAETVYGSASPTSPATASPAATPSATTAPTATTSPAATPSG